MCRLLEPNIFCFAGSKAENVVRLTSGLWKVRQELYLELGTLDQVHASKGKIWRRKRGSFQVRITSFSLRSARSKHLVFNNPHSQHVAVMGHLWTCTLATPKNFVSWRILVPFSDNGEYLPGFSTTCSTQIY